MQPYLNQSERPSGGSSLDHPTVLPGGEASPGSPPALAQSVRRILDYFQVARRLEDIRDSVWRGGSVGFFVAADPRSHDFQAAYYQLAADWPVAVFEPLASSGTGLARRSDGAVEGRWLRGTEGYTLRVGVETQTATAIGLHAPRAHFTYLVPFHQRRDTDVARALASALAAYEQHFLDSCPPVPAASAQAAALLRRHGL